MTHANGKTGSNVLHGEDAGGDHNDKRGGGLERHDAREEFEPQGEGGWNEVDEEREVRELLGARAEVVVGGREDENENEGRERGDGAGVDEREADEMCKVRELLDVGAEVVVEKREDGNEGHEGGAGAGESDLDEERAVLELLGVQVGELDCELEESEVEALVLGLDQLVVGEEARQLTISLGRLSLADIQCGPLRCTRHVFDRYVPTNGAEIDEATTNTDTEDAMDVDPPERDEDAMNVDHDEDTMDVDTVPFL